MRQIGFTIATAMLLSGPATYTRADAAEIAVLAAAAIEQPFETIVHGFEHDTGTKVGVEFGSVGVIQNKLKAGAKPDIVILSTAAVAAAQKDGAVLAGSRAVVGRAEIGVAVRDGTPAAKAGLKAGDILIEFDGKEIGNLYDFTYALRAHKAGDLVLVKVLRGSQTIEAKVLLTERR